MRKSYTKAQIKENHRMKLWDFQLNTEVVQQSHEDQPSLDQVEILNVSCEDRKSHC